MIKSIYQQTLVIFSSWTPAIVADVRQKLSPGKVLPYTGQKSEHVIKSLRKNIQCKSFKNLNTKTCYTVTKLDGK